MHAAAIAETRVLFVGRTEDPEWRLLESLPVQARVLAAGTSDTDCDVVVAVAPLDPNTVNIIEKPLVLLGGTLERPDVVSLPRTPLTAEILDLAIRAAIARQRHDDHRSLAQLHFKRIFEASPVGIALTSVDGVVLAVNPAFTSLLGFDAPELIGRPAASFNDQAQADTTHRALFQRMKGSSVSVRRERRLRRRDGTLLLCEVSTSMLRDDDGTPFALLQTVVDVTARHEAETRLTAEAANRHLAWEETKKAHEFLKAAMHSMPAGVLVVEVPSGKPILANDRYLEFAGLPPALPGELAGAEDRSDVERTIDSMKFVRGDGSHYPADELPLARTLADGKAHAAVDLWVEQTSGFRIPVVARSAAVPYKGRAAAILTLQDVTNVKEQERARRSAEALYRRLFEEAADAILIMTPDDFKIVEANPAAEKLLGRTRAELVGAAAPSLSAESTEGQPRADFAAQREVARRAGDVRFPWRAARKKGGIVEFDVSLQPLPVEGTGALLILRGRDMTRQRVLEDELRQSQKLEAIGLLAGGVAHDYNNLLTGVIGFLELALDRLPEEPELDRVRKFMSEARRAANRSVDLTRQLLTFSRRQQGSPRVMDLNEAVERSSGMVQRLLGETIKLKVELEADGCPINCDSAQLEQVVMNLAINARDAMPRGGTLSVTTRRYVADPAGASILDLPPGDYSTLVISDSGTGMSDSVKTRIFEPFFTTKEVGRGTGLGLAVVHGVVNRHGGKIFVDSVPGQGTTFTIVLPTVLGVALDKRKNDSAAALNANLRGTGSILVVDDDPMVREVTSAMLEALGYKVFKASGAAEALEVVSRETLDLVVSDVVMPETSGVELERRLRHERPNLKVLLVSGYARDAFERQGIAESETQLLRKPLTLESLGRRVRELLGSTRSP